MAKKKISYRESIAEIETIIKEIDGGELDLDEVNLRIVRFRQLMEDCRSLLKETETEAKKLEKFWKKVAETAEIPKTAPLTQRNSRKNLQKSSWNRRNPQNSSPNHSETAGKIHKKVAETAEIDDSIKQMETISSTFKDK